MVSFAIQTLGCKLNQLESEALASAFKAQGMGLLPWGPGADILVVNTCTVTSKAEQKARRIIRKALREHPAAVVVATGCYAQLDGPEIRALAGTRPGPARLLVLAGDRKAALLDLPRHLSAAGVQEGFAAWRRVWEAEGPKELDPFAFTVDDFSFHSRAFLKIQDGCGRRCAYCRASLARGKSVSLEGLTVLSRLRALEERGCAEAVLTGLNITQYQAPLGGGCAKPLALGELLDFLLRETRRIALRLSSLEIDRLGPEFLAVLAHRRIRPHFHLSIQSGSNRILERMRRGYTAAKIEEIVRGLRSRKDDPFLACDIIAGFPGETPEEFEKTWELCRRVDFAWIHAFPYSKRPGTGAFQMRDPAPERDARSRVDALSALARQGRTAYVSRWMGKRVEALIETPDQAPPGHAVALSENYLRLLIPYSAPAPRPGSALICRIQPLPGPSPRFDALALTDW
jgi:threonylcarbamoyladenosine tRNA methylthiotransferase MtaB